MPKQTKATTAPKTPAAKTLTPTPTPNPATPNPPKTPTKTKDIPVRTALSSPIQTNSAPNVPHQYRRVDIEALLESGEPDKYVLNEGITTVSLEDIAEYEDGELRLIMEHIRTRGDDDKYSVSSVLKLTLKAMDQEIEVANSVPLDFSSLCNTPAKYYVKGMDLSTSFPPK